MKPRKIKLLASGAETSIDPREWIAVSNRKVWDADEAWILRVLKHRQGGRWLVYGMHSRKGERLSHPVAEAYEMVAAADVVAHAVKQVVAHCGLEKLEEPVLADLQ